MNYVEPIRDPERVKDIGEYLKEFKYQYYIMYIIGIYSGLRISDILGLKYRDIQNKKEIRIKEKKTGKDKIFPINPAILPIIQSYAENKKPYDYIIASSHNPGKPITRECAYKIMAKAGERFGLENLGTHTLRKTFGYHFYQQTKDLALLMKIFNHTDESKTLRYIGLEQTTINEAMRKFKY